MLAKLTARAMQLAPSGRLSVLIYHRVLVETDPLLPHEPNAAEFEQTMHWLRSAFNVIPLLEGVAGLKSRKLPARALAITFDDGYANNESVAAPILKRVGLHATFFVATGFLDGGRMFNDTIIETIRRYKGNELDLEPLGLGMHSIADIDARRQAIASVLDRIKYRPERERVELANRVSEIAGVTLPTDLMMTSTQVSKLATSGFELGGHTVNHPILAQIDSQTAQREIEKGKRKVEELTDRRVDLFAYPNGRPGRDYVKASTQLVRELGFLGAVSTSPGVARFGSDPYQIPRFTPWASRRLRFAQQMWANMSYISPLYAHT